MAGKYGTCTHVRMISDDSHHASARTVCVVRVLSMAESRTERLHVLLIMSSNHHHLTRTYLIQLSFFFFFFFFFITILHICTDTIIANC